MSEDEEPEDGVINLDSDTDFADDDGDLDDEELSGGESADMEGGSMSTID